MTKENGKEKSLGINDMAKHMKMKPATVRQKLRNANIKKSGKGYAWPNQMALQKDAKRLSAA